MYSSLRPPAQRTGGAQAFRAPIGGDGESSALIADQRYVTSMSSGEGGFRVVADVRVGETVVERGRSIHVERFPDGTNLPWIAFGFRPGDRVHDMSGPRPELVPRHHFAHKAEPQCRLRRDALLVAHERPAQHVAEWDAAVEHADRLQCRNDSHVRMRIEDEASSEQITMSDSLTK